MKRIRTQLGGPIWTFAVPAALLLGITMGSRSAFGLFISPMNTATGLGIATISLAIAISQLAWGVAQPVFGAISDRHGPAPVIAGGGLLLAVTTALIPFATTGVGLTLALSAVAAAGGACGSTSLLIGAVGARVSPDRRGFAAGIVSAGGSAGQLALAPVAQIAIGIAGWANAMLTLAVLALATLPLARPFRRRETATGSSGGVAAAPAVAAAPVGGVREALRSPSYWCVTAGFFVCGFHVAFLTTHLPGVIELCGFPASLSSAALAVIGLCNIAGSIVSGVLIQRVSMRLMLAALYALRGLGVALLLVLPTTPFVMVAFSVWIGLTYMATLPPTAGLIGRLFGLRRLGTLLGLTMFVHQIGSFLGAWLGGLAVETTGGYDWLWYADIVLAAIAALIHLPIPEPAALPARPDLGGTLVPRAA